MSSVSRILVIASFSMLAACSSSKSSDGDGTDTDSGSAAIAPGASDVIVNEFHAVGTDEWMEIANKGSNAFSLDGYAVADSQKGTTTPKTDGAMRFPTGTSIAAGERLVIVTGKKDGVGPYTDAASCVKNGPAKCFHATFGVSANDGEAVHILGPGDAIVSTTFYPRNLALDPTKDESACRLPDLTGELVLCKSTPGAVNGGL